MIIVDLPPKHKMTEPKLVWVDSLVDAHKVLDNAGVPRKIGGEKLTLPERVSFLTGMLAAAREAQVERGAARLRGGAS